MKLLLFISGLALFSPFSSQKKPVELIYVGTFSERGSKGIYVLHFDRDKQSMEIKQTIAGAESPSFITIHPDGKYLYSVNRGSISDNPKEGSSSAFSIDPKNGQLALINQQPTQGNSPCHISTDRNGNYAFVSHYGSGNLTILPIQKDGSLDKVSDNIQHQGSSANQNRQKGPHLHSILPSPDNQYILAADLGIDKTMVYEFDNGKAQQVTPALNAEPGSGPRHFTFHPNGKFVYVAEELSSTVGVYPYLPGQEMDYLQMISTLPKDYQGNNSVADIHFSPSGKYLYVSNRGHNSLVVFEVNATDGKLRVLGHEPIRGDWPRNFLVDPKGEFIWVANRRTDEITMFKIKQDGMLAFTGKKIQIPAPVCLKYLQISNR